MGFLDKLTKKNKPSTGAGQQQAYAPPSGPPPPVQQPGYGQQQQQQYQQQGYGAPPPQQQQQYGHGGYQQQQYAPPPSQPPPSTQRPAGGREDPLNALRKYDTVFLIDDSGSMEMFWEDQLGPALASVIGEAAKYDTDGVDLAFFNSRVTATSKSPQELLSLFQRVWPSASTPTATALRRVLDPYLSTLRQWTAEGKSAGQPRPKPMNLIVLTDGAPDRGEDPEMVIVEAARMLDQMKCPPYQLGIQMIQIGQDDEAAQSLMELDDLLREKHDGIRDIVDTTLFDVNNGRIDSEYLMKALLGGINRSIDNQ